MPTLREHVGALLGQPTGSDACRCSVEAESQTLRIDATECPGGGSLASEPECRRTVVNALRRHARDEIHVEASGRRSWYTADSVRLLTSAAGFAERVDVIDSRLAELSTRHPLRAAAEAQTRVGAVADLADETGLRAAASDFGSVEDAIRAYVGPAISNSRVLARPPPNARLRETYETGSTTVRIYESSDYPVPTYHVEPLEAAFDAEAFAVLASAVDFLVDGSVGTGEHAAHAAVRQASRTLGVDMEPTGIADSLARVLQKHTSGFGVLADIFADTAVESVYANAPADDAVLRVSIAGESMRTNVLLTSAGADRLASRIRTDSGRPFSSSNPLVDASASEVGAAATVRVAGVTDPVSNGTAFAFRAGHTDIWRLPDLVANDTLPSDAAALLGEAVERGSRILVAGPRGAGKTTLLAALLWELRPATRLVAIEDTPELPIRALQDADRDALALRTSTDEAGADVDPAAALRAALRLGDGALVVGEVRGREAAVLYEAMRVGANSSAVLGTIHGEDGESVEERVVNDLDVPRSSFSVTDLVATVGHTSRGRRLVAIEEVTADGIRSLYEYTGDGLTPTGRIRRGTSELVDVLTTPEETYADVRRRFASRESRYEPDCSRESGGGSTPANEGTVEPATDTAAEGLPCPNPER